MLSITKHNIAIQIFIKKYTNKQMSLDRPRHNVQHALLAYKRVGEARGRGVVALTERPAARRHQATSGGDGARVALLLC